MEMYLSTKHKLVFVLGTFPQPQDDHLKAAQWEACNNLVICWIMNSISQTIGKSILYVKSASEIWKHLQRRFSLSNGSRKYKLNKDIYALKENNSVVNEYYTTMRGIWEELDAMCDLPQIVKITEDVTNFLAILANQKEEHNLFQFLNGLDEKYTTIRSQILIMHPLPIVEMACAMIQQGERQ